MAAREAVENCKSKEGLKNFACPQRMSKISRQTLFIVHILYSILHKVLMFFAPFLNGRHVVVVVVVIPC